MLTIGRSSTGTYHKVIGNASSCNGRSFRSAGHVDAATIEAASEESFCKKCFCTNQRDRTRKDNARFLFDYYQSR